jgi:hypothetical protein
VPSVLQPRRPFPVARWFALVWLAIWVPAYWRVWGWKNFFHVCDVSVILACAGIWFGNRLLISSQALASLLPDALWCLDAGWRVITGHTLFGGTEYMWDSRFPLWVRLLSLFHIVLPIILVAACARIGYDRRALALQAGIAAVLLLISRSFGPDANMNYAFRDPVLHRAWGPAPVHLALIFAGTVLLIYWPAQMVFCRAFARKHAAIVPELSGSSG